MLAKAHLRRFGVEIECGLHGGTSRARELFPGWSVSADGSGVELKTEILRGEEGFKTIRYAMDRLKANGAWVTRADGMHVHHDAPEFERDAKKCLLLVQSWNNNLNAIHNMVAPRRRTSGACPSWRAGEIDALRQWSEGNGRMYGNRSDLNLLALSEHGSIEIRLHEGTLDADVAIAWIKFGQRFIDDVLQRARPLKNTMSDVSLMGKLRLSKSAQRILAEKRLRGHDTPASQFRGGPY